VTEPRRYEPVTLGEIKELAGVGRPTVSNWRRRHDSFPAPVGGSDSKPLFDAEEIAAWLDRRPMPDADPGPDGSLPTYGERFRDGLRLRKLVALGHGESDAEDMIVRALAVAAMEGEGGGSLEKYLYDGLLRDFDRAEPQLMATVRELVEEEGSAGTAADTILGLAARLESDLAMDATPDAVAGLIATLADPPLHGPEVPVVLNLCAGIGELLFALGDVDGLGEVAAVEPDPLRRRIFAYRLLAHWAAEVVEIRAGTEDLASIRPHAQQLLSQPDPEEKPWGFPLADVVLADPPYASGERERDEGGPLGWALEAVRRLKPGGQGYVVVPSWTLSRPRGTSPTPNVRMREELLGRDAVSAVVQLPRRIHPFRTGAEHALLVLRGDKGPADRDRVMLVDADRIARRIGGAWTAYVAEVLSTGHSPVTEEADWFRVSAAGPRGESLLDGRSVLPAHRLASVEAGVDHFSETLDARRAASVALPELKDWIGNLGVGKRPEPVRHRKVDEHIRAGQLRLLAGHRIRETDVGDAGLIVVGREEMIGALPFGERRIAVEDLAVTYPKAATTERGDVLLFTEHGVTTRVDNAGGCVLLAPVQGLRIAAYRKYLTEVAKGSSVPPESVWMRPYPLAKLLAAPRNQQRGSGSLVRRVSVRDMDLPQLAPEEVAELEAVLAETDRHREEVQRRLDALDTLARRLAAGVADGELSLRRRPGSG
jgi:hypothetical protein